MHIEGIHYQSGKPLRLTIEQGRIAFIETLADGTTGDGHARTISAENARAGAEASSSAGTRTGASLLCPGFFDIQVNGYGGVDYSAPGLTEARIEQLVLSLASEGTVRHFPTIITGPRARIVENCAVIARAAASSPLIRHAVLGIHIEGPFISSEEGPRGAHDPHWIRLPDIDEFHEWQDAAEGLIKIVTLAPELEGALNFIEMLTEEGVIAAIGHTAASPQQVRDAVAAGARLSTHLGNGSHRLLPRLNNYLWEQLAEDRLAASIIADGFHLPDSVLRVIYRAKGADRLVLTSDAAFLAGSPPGLYQWGDMAVRVHSDGHLGLEGTEFLAGAGHLLDRGIPRMMAACGIPLAEAVLLCTRNPARLLGLPAECTEFVPGSQASVVRLRLIDGLAGGLAERTAGDAAGTAARDAAPALEIEEVILAGQPVRLTPHPKLA